MHPMYMVRNKLACSCRLHSVYDVYFLSFDLAFSVKCSDAPFHGEVLHINLNKSCTHVVLGVGKSQFLEP